MLAFQERTNKQRNKGVYGLWSAFCYSQNTANLGKYAFLLRYGSTIFNEYNVHLDRKRTIGTKMRFIFKIRVRYDCFRECALVMYHENPKQSKKYQISVHAEKRIEEMNTEREVFRTTIFYWDWDESLCAVSEYTYLQPGREQQSIKRWLNLRFSYNVNGDKWPR